MRVLTVLMRCCLHEYHQTDPIPAKLIQCLAFVLSALSPQPFLDQTPFIRSVCHHPQARPADSRAISRLPDLASSPFISASSFDCSRHPDGVACAGRLSSCNSVPSSLLLLKASGRRRLRRSVGDKHCNVVHKFTTPSILQKKKKKNTRNEETTD